MNYYYSPIQAAFTHKRYLDNKIEYNFTEKAGDVMSSWNLTVLTMHGHTIASLQQLLADTP